MSEPQDFEITVQDSLGNKMELTLSHESNIEEVIEKLRLILWFFGFSPKLVSEYMKERKNG